MSLAVGTKLGPYEILSPIGSSGMGEVWKARDTRLGRIVMIKKVKEQHSERFKQEARTIVSRPFVNMSGDYVGMGSKITSMNAAGYVMKKH